MIPAKLPLEKFTAGDRWAGIPALAITVNGITPASPITAARLRFKKSTEVLPNPPVELSNANSKLTIVSAANWEISVPPQIVPELTAGDWLFQLKITAADGSLDTYISDKLTVLETV
jgi:hypothetical protein